MKSASLNRKNSLEMLTDSRVKREREYHNCYFAEGNREPTQKFYHVFGASTEHYERQLTALGCAGKRVLEYGCGDGQWSHAYFLAERGADVTGIDISDVAIQLAQDEADRRGLRKATFRMMNAEQLEFADSSFDLICGSAILHHLDLERSYAELARVLTCEASQEWISRHARRLERGFLSIIEVGRWNEFPKALGWVNKTGRGSCLALLSLASPVYEFRRLSASG